MDKFYVNERLHLHREHVRNLNNTQSYSRPNECHNAKGYKHVHSLCSIGLLVSYNAYLHVHIVTSNRNAQLFTDGMLLSNHATACMIFTGSSLCHQLASYTCILMHS